MALLPRSHGDVVSRDSSHGGLRSCGTGTDVVCEWILLGADTRAPSRRSRPSQAAASCVDWTLASGARGTRVTKEACAPCSGTHVHTSGAHGSQDRLPKGATLPEKPSTAVFDTEKLDVPV